MKDISGNLIKQSRIKRSITLLIITGGAGSVWFTFCGVGQILNVFIQNHLGASDQLLGILNGFLSFVGVFNMGAIFLYYYAKRIKPVFVFVTFLSKSSAFFLSAAAFFVHFGGNKATALIVVILSTVLLSSVANNLTGPLWWTWISHLIPEKKRASLLGIRTSISQFSSILLFFAATFCLDFFQVSLFFVYGLFYLIAGISGLTDIILHCFIPEPYHPREGKLTFSSFIAPLKDKTFMKFAMIIGFTNTSINISIPFQAPYITNPDTIGAPNIWLGIMFIISQVTWIVMAPFWGTMIDRLGKKPVILFGLLAPLAFSGYIFLNSENYYFVLPLIAFSYGFLSPAFSNGITQLMLSFTPDVNRVSYIGWFHSMMGIIGALGPVLGGYIMGFTLGSISVTTAISLVLVAVSFFFCTRIKSDDNSAFSQVAALMVTPSTIRTYYQIPILASTTKPDKVEKALKSVNRKTGTLVIEEILTRLEDPDEGVRKEATHALGRISSPEAREKLITLLGSTHSLLQPEAAHALGEMKDPEASKSLIEALYSEAEIVRKEAALALGKFRSGEAMDALLKLIKEDRSESVKVTGAQSIAFQGNLNAIDEILHLWEHTENDVLKKQLIISMGNLIGKPGEIYKLITGSEEKQNNAIELLFNETKINLKKLKKTEIDIIDFILRDSFPALENEYESKNYNHCFDHLYGIVMNLISRELELKGTPQNEDSIAVFLRETDSFLFLGFYLVHHLEIIRKEKNNELRSPEILLVIYFLKYFCSRKIRNRKVPPL